MSVDERKEQNNDEIDTKKDKKIFGKIFEGMSNIAKRTKAKIDKHSEEKKLEKRLVELFNSKALKFTLMDPNKKRGERLYVRVDYDQKTITVYGKPKQINKDVYFIDELNQKFNIHQIRLNQNILLVLDGIEYNKSCITIDYILHNDEKTRDEMKTIINNNQITITDSTINKSDIG